MADDPDRLSQLPDELLQHILHLAPCREAESTSVLSRRWHRLWPPTTGAVKIDIPSASFRAADEALAASHGHVERLAIHVGEDCNKYADVVADVLSHPASRGVQDLRIRARTSRGRRTGADSDDDDSCSRMPYWSLGEFRFSFVSVPSVALRVLHNTNCDDHTTAPQSTSTFFPCLEVLRLRRCSVTLESLQDMVVASPQLTVLQLEYVRLVTGYYTYSDDDDDDDDDDYDYDPGRWVSTQSFCCPAITTLVLLNCFCEQKDGWPTELDVPRVQHFKFRGKINQFTLRAPLPDVRRAHLHILDSYPSGRAEACASFWRFLKNFSSTKVLKLKLEWPIYDIAALERRRIWDLLGENDTTQSIMFCVDHLELDALYYPNSKDVGVAIGNLLQCCPALHDLRLKLNTVHQPRRRSKAQLEFHKSIDHFRHRRDRSVLPLCGDDDKFEFCDISGLSDRWIHFRCLRFHLRKLRLQFHNDKANKPNSFGVQLVKFFIKRGMALEEIYIHDGNTKMWEHMNCKISGYAANPQPISEHQFFTRMSETVSMKRFSRSKINGCLHPHKLEVRRTNRWCASETFTIFPLADT